MRKALPIEQGMIAMPASRASVLDPESVEIASAPPASDSGEAELSWTAAALP